VLGRSLLPIRMASTPLLSVMGSQTAIGNFGSAAAGDD
jgi:hypothetical protein